MVDNQASTIQSIQSSITAEQQRLEQLKQTQAKYGQDTKTYQQYKDFGQRVEEQQRLINNLSTSLSQAQQGYSAEQAQALAYQKTYNQTAIEEQRRQQRNQLQNQQAQSIQSQNQQVAVDNKPINNTQQVATQTSKQTGFYVNGIRYENMEDYIRNKPDKSTISEYKPLTFYQKTKAALIPGQKEALKLATREDRASLSGASSAGIEIVKNAQGEYVDRETGQPVNTNLGEPLVTRQDIADYKLAIAEAPAKNIQAQVEKQVTEEAQVKAQERLNYYQEKVNTRELDADTATKLYQTDIKGINEQASLTLQDRLKYNQDYIKATKDYQSTAAKLGASQDVYGKTFFPALEKEPLKGGEVIREAAKIGLMFTPLGGPVMIATAPTELILTKDERIEERLTREGQIQTGLGIAFTGAAIFGGISGTLTQPKLVNAESIAKASSRQADYLRKLSLNQIDKSYKIRSISEIKEARLPSEIKAEFLEAQSRKQLLELSRKNPVTGRTEKVFALTETVKSTPELQAEAGYTFKVRGNKITNQKAIALAIDKASGKGQIFTAEIAPEKLLAKVKVKGNNPLEVYSAERLNAPDVYDILVKGQQKEVVLPSGKILRAVESKSVSLKTGKVKGEFSIADITNPKVPKVVKVSKADKLYLSDVNELQLLNERLGGEASLKSGFGVAKGKVTEKSLIDLYIQKVFNKRVKQLSESPKVNFRNQPSQPVNLAQLEKQINKPAPSYVGGEGGIDAQSIYQFDSSSIFAKSGVKAEDLGFSKIRGPKIPTPKFEEGRLLKNPKGGFNVNVQDIGVDIINTDKLYRDLIKVRGGTFNAATTKTASGESFNLRQQQRLKFAEIQIQTPKQIQQQINRLTKIQPQRFEMPRTPRQPISPVFDIPFFGGGSGQGGGLDKQLKKLMEKRRPIKSGYTASLAAAAFQAKPIKVTQKEYKRLSESIFSGAETRPLLEIVSDKQLAKEIRKVKF